MTIKDSQPTQSEATTPQKEKSLKELSAVNIERILTDFIKKAVDSGLSSNGISLRNEIITEASEVVKKYFYSINLTANSIARLVEIGKIETIWDHPNIELLRKSATANNKSLPDDYLEIRRVADNGLRNFVLNDAKLNPVSAALATSTKDMVEGAAPRYGNWAIFIVPSPETEQRTVFSAEDSFRSVSSETLEFDNKNILTLQHALIASVIHRKFFEMFLDPSSQKRIHKLRNYVEAAIFDNITLESISLIICTLNTEDEVNSAKTILGKIGPIRNKMQFVFGDDISPSVRQGFNFNSST